MTSINLIKSLRSSNLSVFMGFFFLTFSCSQYDNENLENFEEYNNSEVIIYNNSMRNISEELRFDSLNKISSLIEQTEITIEYFESMNSPIEHINASEAEILITDLVRETNVSLSNLGFDSNLMENFFGSNDDPRIALVGLGLISGLKVDASPNALVCLGSAVGADLFIALGEAIVSYVGSGSASALTAETLFSIGVGGLKKVLRNFLGPIGIAVAAYSFVDCMEWI